MVTDLKRIIAYSTMSQIGYMVMGVSIGAYAGGLFMLMAHAFFKALLFMAAGSVIAAMANIQNIDRMSGFRRAMPFTSALLIVGCLALAAFPFTSGFFSKDEILGFAANRGGMYWIFAIGGYIGALMTAFYSFRIGFRVVAGPPCDEAKELEEGHIHHAEPTNPTPARREDADVGFPGAEHHIAEREWPMKVAMGVLGFGALFIGLIQVPGIDHVVTTFLDGTFESSVLYHARALDRRLLDRPRDRRHDRDHRDLDRLPLLRATPGGDRAARRAPPAHPRLPLQQVVLRRADRRARLPPDDRDRAASPTRCSSASSCRGMVGGHDRRGQGRGLGGPRRPVRPRARLRAAAGRRLRRPRHLLPGGGELMAHRCSTCCCGRRWSPGCSRCLVPRVASRWVAVLGALVTLGLAIGLVADFDAGATGLQHVVDESWIPDLGVRYQLGVDGISVFLILMTAVLWFAVTLWSALRDEPGDERDEALLLPRRAGRDRGARRVHGARTCCCSSSSST